MASARIARKALSPESPMEVHQSYDGDKVAFSYGLAVLGSLTTVILLDQRRRSRRRRDQQMFLMMSSLSLGGCGIWAMHTMGMSALHLTDEHGIEYHSHFEIGLTLLSLLVAIVFVHIGLAVAVCDRFFGEDSDVRVERLAKRIASRGMKSVVLGGRALVMYEALCSDLQCVMTGGIISASGLLVMHYLGMSAMSNVTSRTWSMGLIALSAGVAVIASCTAFWLLIRVLEWRQNLTSLRVVATLIMGLAVCGMHYTGMAAAHYSITTSSEVPNAAIHKDRDHQIVMWAVASQVVWCVCCLLYCHSRVIEQNHQREREIDRMYRVLLLSTAVGRKQITSVHVSSMAPFTSKGAARIQASDRRSSSVCSTSVRSGDAAGAMGSSADRDRMLNFVGEAVRYFVGQTTRRSKIDAESIEQLVTQTLRVQNDFISPRKSSSAPVSPITRARIGSASVQPASFNDSGGRKQLSPNPAHEPTAVAGSSYRASDSVDSVDSNDGDRASSPSHSGPGGSEAYGMHQAGGTMGSRTSTKAGTSGRFGASARQVDVMTTSDAPAQSAFRISGSLASRLFQTTASHAEALVLVDMPPDSPSEQGQGPASTAGQVSKSPTTARQGQGDVEMGLSGDGSTSRWSSTRRASWSKGAKILPSLPQAAPQAAPQVESVTAPSACVGSLSPADAPSQREEAPATGSAGLANKAAEPDAHLQGGLSTTQSSMNGTLRRRSDNTDVRQSSGLQSGGRQSDSLSSGGRSSRALGVHRASEPSLPVFINSTAASSTTAFSTAAGGGNNANTAIGEPKNAPVLVEVATAAGGRGSEARVPAMYSTGAVIADTQGVESMTATARLRVMPAVEAWSSGDGSATDIHA